MVLARDADPTSANLRLTLNTLDLYMSDDVIREKTLGFRCYSLNLGSIRTNLVSN